LSIPGPLGRWERAVRRKGGESNQYRGKRTPKRSLIEKNERRGGRVCWLLSWGGSKKFKGQIKRGRNIKTFENREEESF